MQISNRPQMRHMARRSNASTPITHQPSDSVTLGRSHNSLTGAAVFGGLGLVPVVGFMSNFGIGAQAGMNDHKAASSAAGYGALANLAGTAVTAGGLLFSNEIATKVGLGMLGFSGAAGAYAGFVAS